MGYVFISYSTKNQEQANKLCNILKNRNIDYWIATEHISGGENYAKIIPSSIKSCSCVILLLSEASQQSVYVSNEIDRAINAKKPVFPIRVEECNLTDEFDFYLCRCQIINAYEIEDNTPTLSQILEIVNKLTNVGKLKLSVLPAPKRSSEEEMAEVEQIIKSLNSFNVWCEYADKNYTGRLLVRYYFRLTKPWPEVDMDYLSSVIIMNLSHINKKVDGEPYISFVKVNGEKLLEIELSRTGDRQVVNFNEAFDKFTALHQGKLSFPLGVDFDDKIHYLDVAKSNGIFIAGISSSGKTTILNNIIMSLALSHSPSEVQFILVDPKTVELRNYNNLPHLYCPIINEFNETLDILRKLSRETEKRLELFSTIGKRNIDDYNEISDEKIPRIIMIVDELADFLTYSKTKLINAFNRLLQKSRAVGIHIIFTTGIVRVFTKCDLFLSNFDIRIGMRSSAYSDSMIILGTNDAVRSVGYGDLYYKLNDDNNLIRLQAPFLTRNEILENIKNIDKN